LNKPVTGKSATFHYPYSLDMGVEDDKRARWMHSAAFEAKVSPAAVMGTKTLFGPTQQFEMHSRLWNMRSIRPVENTVDAALMSALLSIILGDLPGVEGGYWYNGQGFVASAFPTHAGSEEKKMSREGHPCEAGMPVIASQPERLLPVPATW
jgi:hypothetical protein